MTACRPAFRCYCDAPGSQLLSRLHTSLVQVAHAAPPQQQTQHVNKPLRAADIRMRHVIVEWRQA
eukprot:6191883-Pleurochrysis_carterae.AAC.1